ncbi:MAG: hypothetical protein A3K19_13485 [Lentisphaerae bacterium RIFOXYB12_FULL_65_16]|nr:MAG: hypothetical protein A3K18_29005 [Lentisphaerae bacterium RIFOXYA12_64_32]OGV86305.1 MAG: hypothetical protein A3K19_13485 [Lentisphaerae bacterium RIFOXYB12_FULL_65_16]
MSNSEHFRKLERMSAAEPMNGTIPASMKVGDGTAEVVVQVRPEFHHCARAVHGAVYFKALDDAAYFAASSAIEDMLLVTVSFTVYFTRPVSQGEMKARGRLVHQSRRLLVAEAELLDSAGRIVARGSGTFMESRTPLSPQIGYC